MAIVRWDPWRELAGFERQFDELFGRGRQSSRGGTNTWVPALDVHQDGDTMVICAELAGVDPDKVDIEIDDNVLTMSGRREENRKVDEGQWIRRERTTGQFRRSITLPPGVDPSKVKATANNGVIEVRVPRPTQSEPHRVPLSSGGNGAKSVDVGSKSSSNASASKSTGTTTTTTTKKASRSKRSS